MSRCAACPAEIRWVHTEKGKLMPIDAEPSPTGNIILTSDTDVKVYRDHDTAVGMIDVPTYTSHFVTCSHADQFRRKK